ncbi:MAG: hypothetical protein JOZ69_08830, partial [Myxococcales bacterium]|nr:hypothetical protein [Myxococcales bacterium]
MPQEEPRVGGQHIEPRSVEASGAGATAEAVGAAAAIVLAILGLAGTLTFAMMTIGVIVLGSAMLMDSAGVSARYERLLSQAFSREGATAHARVGGGLAAESLGGLAGIALGVLGLIGFAPVTLSAAALVVFGASLLFGSANKSRLAAMVAAQPAVPAAARRVLEEVNSLSAGGDVLVGVAPLMSGSS